MLAPFPLNPILPAKDGARAEAFYRDVLGLEQLSPPGMDSEDNILALNELRGIGHRDWLGPSRRRDASAKRSGRCRRLSRSSR